MVNPGRRDVHVTGTYLETNLGTSQLHVNSVESSLVNSVDISHLLVNAPTSPSRSELLRSSDNRGGMKRPDKEIRKKPSGDPSSGENPGILL